MSDKTKNNHEPIIDVVRYNTLEYVFDCLSYFNAGHERVTLRAYGGNLAKGVQIARILQEEAGITVQKSSLDSIMFEKTKIPFIEIPLKIGAGKLDKKNAHDKGEIKKDFANFDFVNYSTYHLLLDWYLKKTGNLKILTRDSMKRAVPLLDIQEKNGNRTYTSYMVEELEKSDGIKKDEVNTALSRCGLFLPEKWCEIGEKLSKYDDIILGLDTNILYHCSMSRHLLPIVSLIEPREFVHTPNWLLLIVPSTVMYELEEAVNIRDKGFLVYKGRMGFRALQEVMELSENINIPGVSLLIHGETNPVLDMKNNIFAIRKDIGKYVRDLNGNQFGQNFKKSSGGDMAIRYQFKKFLSQIDFHKGTFFLTADKSCSALAQAEGLCPIYIPYSHLFADNPRPFSITECYEKGIEGTGELTFSAPLGSILYELAVSFGEIIISCGDQSPSIECDRRGDDIGRWVHKQLRISKDDLGILLRNYSGRFNLDKACRLFKKITKKFENVEWLTEMGGAFKHGSSS